jgi:hypothetical protein
MMSDQLSFPVAISPEKELEPVLMPWRREKSLPLPEVEDLVVQPVAQGSSTQGPRSSLPWPDGYFEKITTKHFTKATFLMTHSLIFAGML